MPPAYVKPYVKRQKNDMADAEAICEAVARANMRFVPTMAGSCRELAVAHRAKLPAQRLFGNRDAELLVDPFTPWIAGIGPLSIIRTIA